MKVAICIATYRRPRMLSALLHSLSGLELDAPAPDLVVVVVDNDAEGAAAASVEAHRARLPWPIRFAIEPTRNIARARNRCVSLALAEGADLLAFVDDDERVSPRWLAELLRVRERWSADIVGGTVVNDYPDETPAWIVKARLPERMRMATGTETAAAQTSNMLVARGMFERLPGGFDERFGLSGGSDTHFVHRARLAGGRVVWADDAVVSERFVASRTTLGWLLRRSFREGNAAVAVARSIRPVWRWLPRRLAAAGYRLGRGLLFVVPALALGRVAMARALRDLCIAAGALSALAGYRYVEYEQPHGE